MTRRTDCVLGAALCVAVGVAVWAGRPPEAGWALRAVCVGALLLGSGVAWVIARRRWSRRAVLGLAVALRLAAVPMAPALSDDAYRYLWDGGLTAAGVSPYAARPDAPELVRFRDVAPTSEWYARMNSPHYHTVYPPLSQAVFAVAALAGSTPAAWLVLKSLLLAAEGVGIWALSRVLAPGRLALYALSPVAVIEIAGQGHSEGLLVGALGLGWWGLVRGRRTVLGAAVVAAGWIKLYPFALGALLARRLRPTGWLATGTVAALAGTPLLAADGWAHLLESVRLYGGVLDFYSAPYLVLKALAYPAAGESAGRLAAGALSLGWLGAVLAAWRRDDGSLDAARRLAVVVIVGYAVAGPMAHPWNWLGALAFAPLLTTRAPLLWLVGVAPLTYLRYVEVPGAYAAALWIGWGGALLLWLASRYRAPRTASGVTVRASTQR